MKKVNLKLIRYVFLLAVTFSLTTINSSCNMTGNIVLNEKEKVVSKLNVLNLSNAILDMPSDSSSIENYKAYTRKSKAQIEDFRYEIIFQ